MTYRVAFDLDDTLISPTNEFAYESFPPPGLVKFLGFEPLRRPIQLLVKSLKKHNIEVWVYTSSFRSKAYIRLLFLLYGIHLDGIVNGKLHKTTMKNMPSKPSKFPPAFGIDLLIDDLEGVKLEGRKYNFEVIRIIPSDSDWDQKISSYLLRKGNISQEN